MIPYFNHEGIIPPFVGDITLGSLYSPYRVSIWEVVDRFATSKQRCKILNGFIDLCHQLMENGFKGFQWINGSFTQDLITREPNDIDIVNFLNYSIEIDEASKLIIQNNLHKNFGSKGKYLCDSFIVDISKNNNQESIIRQTVYWHGLFSHTRDKLWKGMLEIELPYTYFETNFLKHFLFIRDGLV